MFDNDNLICLINKIEKDLKTMTVLGQFQLGLALKVIEDRLWDIDTILAQRCKDLQHKILENGK